MRRSACALLLLAIGACAASRDDERRGTTEPRAATSADDVAALSWGDRGRASYGVVIHREIGLVGASFVLAEARSCRDVPRPAARRDVLLDVDADASRCRLRPYHGSVALSLQRADGRWWNDVIELVTDEDGRVGMRFAELDRMLAQEGAQLDDFTALRVGRDGWAGTYDLARLRGVQADLHAQWVARGRGAPGLFAVRYVDHPRTDRALELALEARLARQDDDFAAVQRGELGPAAFLDRHVWSPLRHRVGEMLLEQRKPTDAEP
jgi:hypothetical protein